MPTAPDTPQQKLEPSYPRLGALAVHRAHGPRRCAG